MRNTTRSRYAATAILLLMASSMARAQEPEAELTSAPARTKVWPDRTKIWPKHWYKDRFWWIGEAVIAGILATDAYSTAVGRSRCPTCDESNIFLGKHPTNGQITRASIAFLGIGSTLHAFAWKACPDVNRRSRAWRVVCNAAVPSIGAAVVPPRIIRNFGLKSPAASVSASSSLMMRPEIVDTMPFQSLKPVISQENGRTLLMPKQFAGCSHSLTLCTSFQPTAASKVDLRSVQFR